MSPTSLLFYKARHQIQYTTKQGKWCRNIPAHQKNCYQPFNTEISLKHNPPTLLYTIESYHMLLHPIKHLENDHKKHFPLKHFPWKHSPSHKTCTKSKKVLNKTSSIRRRAINSSLIIPKPNWFFLLGYMFCKKKNVPNVLLDSFRVLINLSELIKLVSINTMLHSKPPYIGKKCWIKI